MAEEHDVNLTPEDLKHIASWSPIDPNFDAERVIKRILRHIDDSETFAHGVFEDGGLSNYYAFLVCKRDDLIHRPQETYRQLTPVAVYLSLCAPLGVIGHTTASYGTHFCSVKHLELDQLIDPTRPDDDTERFVIDTITETGFRLLQRVQVSEPLPTGVQPFEYCFCNTPWDKAFHVLFANTD